MPLSKSSLVRGHSSLRVTAILGFGNAEDDEVIFLSTYAQGQRSNNKLDQLKVAVGFTRALIKPSLSLEVVSKDIQSWPGVRRRE